MRKFVVVTFALFLLLPAYGQKHFTLVQTSTFQYLPCNPNLHIEKHLGGQASVSLELMYTNRSWTSDGTLFGGDYFRAKGFLIGLAPRLYFPMRKEIPNAWYVSVMLRYSLAEFSNFTYYDFDLYDDYDYRADVTESETEIGLVFGRTFFLWKPVTADVFIGAGSGYGDRERTFIDGHFENFKKFETYGLGKFYFGFKIGYCFGAKK